MSVISSSTANSNYFPKFNSASEVGYFFADMVFSINNLHSEYQPVQIGKSHVCVPITKSYKAASLIAKTVLVVSTVSLYIFFGVIPATIPLLLTLILKMLASRVKTPNQLENLDEAVDSTQMSTQQKKEALSELFDWFKSHIVQGDPKHLDKWHPGLLAPDVTQKTDAEIDDLFQDYGSHLIHAMCDGSDRTSAFLCGMTISKKSIALALATQDIIHRCWTIAVDRDGVDQRWSRLPELWFHTKCFSKDSFKALSEALKRDPVKAQNIKKCMEVDIEKSQVSDRIFMSLYGIDIVTTRMRTWKDA